MSAVGTGDPAIRVVGEQVIQLAGETQGIRFVAECEVGVMVRIQGIGLVESVQRHRGGIV